MSINITKFINRPKTIGNSIDYIAMVNETLKTNPTSIDPNSPLYIEAIKQYNGELKKGNTVRLEIPPGFCGCIEPNSGEYRVRPTPDLETIPPGQNIPTNTLSVTPSSLIEGEYPIDQCLQNGLAGSPAYSQFATRETDGEFGEYTKISNTICGSDEQVITSSGVNWARIFEDPFAGAPLTSYGGLSAAGEAGGNSTEPPQLYAPKYNTSGATQIFVTDGFVWNPENSRGKGKSVWPTKYLNKIAWVTYFGGSYNEKAEKASPDESGPRARYYSISLIGALPITIRLRAHIVDNGVANDVWILIPNTRVKMK